MRLVAIDTGNFKALGGEREWLDIPDGIIGITGDNGKGKSTLMTAVAYAFYGPDVIETGNADVVTWGAKGAYVNVWFLLDGTAYMVHRRSDGKNSSATLQREGEPIAQSATEVTAEITRLLGVDRVGFLASVFSQQEDLLGIGSLQPAKRQSTVLRLLGIDQVDVAIKKLSEETRDLNKELALVRSMVQPVMDESVTKGPEYIAECDDLLDDLGSKIHEVEGAIEELTETIRGMDSKVEDYNKWATNMNSLRSELETVRKEFDKATADANKDIGPHPERPDPYVEPELYLSKMREYDVARKAQSQSICPTCKRPYDAADAEEIQRNVESLADWVADYAPVYEAVKRWTDASMNYKLWVDRKAYAKERANLLIGELDAVQKRIDEATKNAVENPSAGYNAALLARKRQEDRLSDLRVRRERVRSDRDHAKRALAEREQLRKTYAEHEARINGLEHQVLVNTHTSKLMTEYKADLIANVVPSITARASSLITEMTEGKYTEVSLTPQYDIEYRNDQGDLKSFANLSGGEKDVFALALRLAIADIKAGSVGILVLDEVLESLDTSRQEATWEALERLSNRYNQIFVITHVDAFKDRAPHSLAV